MSQQGFGVRLVSLIAPFLLLGAPGVQAQAKHMNSIAPPPTPKQRSAPKAQPLNPKLPTVFIIGDSTARNQANLGWGDHFAHFFDTNRINVANRAIAGRSSRSYIAQGHWAHVLKEIKPGDYVLIQMGHNDGGALGGRKQRGSLKGIGNQTKQVTLPDGRVVTVHTYGWYIRKYIADTRAKGAHPILLALTIRNIWHKGPNGKMLIERDMGYDAELRKISANQHVPYIDMSDIEANRFEAMGPKKTAAFFPIDHTHTSAAGAEFVAQCVVDALRRQHSPLAAYLKH